MLRVTAILEGGLDLDKGEEIPRSIVVSNGAQSVTIPIPESKVQELVAMFAMELEGKGQTRSEVLEPAAPPPRPRPRPSPVLVHQAPLFETEPEPPPMTMPEEVGFQPGEEYEESGTGVASL